MHSQTAMEHFWKRVFFQNFIWSNATHQSTIDEIDFTGYGFDYGCTPIATKEPIVPKSIIETVSCKSMPANRSFTAMQWLLLMQRVLFLIVGRSKFWISIYDTPAPYLRFWKNIFSNSCTNFHSMKNRIKIEGCKKSYRILHNHNQDIIKAQGQV